ncbi:MAG: NADH-quinone oxidoreductase subunit N [Planctomycetes bacterium]|nr:NADH-quinone oxidoreductase subunit N [Planctomycetota bacterium]
MAVDFNTIKLLWPEITLVAMATAIYLGSAFRRGATMWTAIAVASFVVAGVPLVDQIWKGNLEPSGPLTVDFLAVAFRSLAIFLGILFTLAAGRSTDDDQAGEVLGSLMLIIVGLMLVVTSGELVLMFVGLELISIPTYVLLFLGRRDRASAESTVKYFFLGILSSALLLYGFSFLYGLAGSMQLNEIAAVLRAAGESGFSHGLLASVAFVLILAGLGFKIAAVPFHFYAPDVYQGTTHINAGLLAVIPKIAGVVALVRLVPLLTPSISEFAWHLLVVLAILTMTLGNICALWQKNLRRLMAYSSIAHAGYLLIGIAAGLAVPESGGISAALFYLLVYSLATLGAFAAFAFLRRGGREVERVDDLAGLIRVRPGMAGVIAVFMFSLTGIPPLAGFWGKFTLLSSAVDIASGTGAANLKTWFLILAIAGAVNAAIAAAYYLRVIAVMFFRSAQSELAVGRAAGAGVTAALCAIFVTLVGILPGQWMRYAQLADRPRLDAVESTPRNSAARSELSSE